MSQRPLSAEHIIARPHRFFTLRSILLGLMGVIFINALTPYNDYALNNAPLVGNNLPLGVVVLTWLFMVLINGPLSRYWPRFAFSTGEMALLLSMMLVGCALPSAGLMRYFPGSLLAPWWLSIGNVQYKNLMESLGLPAWLYPRFHGDSPSQWMNDPVITGFFARWTEEEPIPYFAWVRPALTWGIFIFALYGALMCLLVIVRRQWLDNERLRFPLADIQLALIEQPKAGEWLNSTMRDKAFWIAFSVVFLIRLWNGLSLYWPKTVPEIPLSYDLHLLATQVPWKFVHPHFFKNEVFFIAIGVTYFISTPVAFSLWIFFVFDQVFRMTYGTASGEAPLGQGGWDRHFGAIMAFTLSVLWIGRRQWQLVIAQAFRGVRPHEPRGRYLPYPVAFWGLVACSGTMVLWLWMAGCILPAAAVIVLLMLLAFMVITRVVGEAGLVYGQLLVPLHRPWQLLAQYGWGNLVPTKTFFLSAMVNVTFYDFREPMPVYAAHGLKLADQSLCEGEEERMQRWFGKRFVALLFLSLLVAYVVSFASTLWTEYHYEASQDSPNTQQSPINSWGTYKAEKQYVMDPTLQFINERRNANYNPLAHVGFGFALTSALAYLRLRYTWWPLHPIGFLLLATTPGYVMWFSIFIGWLCKVVTLRLGGASLYARGKPLFIGLIVGESVAAAFWLVTNVILNAMNIPYHTVSIMPP